MERSGIGWDNEEDKQLTMLYSKYKMELTEIAEIHKRSVSVIQTRLQKLGIFNDTVNFTLDNVFFMVRNSTFNNLDHVSRETVMNGVCAELYEQWNIPHEVLAKQMETYCFEYRIICSQCGEYYLWNETCKKC